MYVLSIYRISFYFENRKYIFSYNVPTVIFWDSARDENKFVSFLRKVCAEKAPLFIEIGRDNQYFEIDWFSNNFLPNDPCMVYFMAKPTGCLPCNISVVSGDPGDSGDPGGSSGGGGGGGGNPGGGRPRGG